MLLRARVLLPITRPPIDDGAVLVAGNRIAKIGRWKELRHHHGGETADLGDVILLPGLVNAHCHLDYTSMAGELAPPRKFTDWLKLITTSKSGLTYSDFAESWLRGAKMLVRNGTTTVGDTEMVPELLPDVWSATPLRVISFLEMTGVMSRRPAREIVGDALKQVRSLPKGRCRGAFSPHAPYSTTPELLHLAARTSRQRRLRVSIHVAESDQEYDMFTLGKGEMFEWLKRNRREMTDCGHGTPVQHLHRLGVLRENLLAIHANYLGPDDAALLGERKVHVVHCPRSHTYFQHRRFPLEDLVAAGVNICLGTDSLASVYKRRKQHVELSLFDEMREFAGKHPQLEPAAILAMATVNAARALGLFGRAGEIAPDAFADLIALPLRENTDPWAAVVHHRGHVAASMIDGEWVIPPPA